MEQLKLERYIENQENANNRWKKDNKCKKVKEFNENQENEIKDINAGKKQCLMARSETKLEVTVWARAFHESDLIWGVIARYANVLIIDEVSMMHNETVTFLMERFKQHKIFLCGDPGFQLAAYSTNADSGAPKTPFNAAKLNIPKKVHVHQDFQSQM